MKIMYKTLVFFSFFTLAPVNAYAADSTYEVLHRNPFEKPKSMNFSAAKKDSDNVSKTSPVELVLKGTLTADKQSLANVNGNLLTIGEMIEGYKLISIQIGSAVLLRGEEKLTLEVNENYKEQK